MKLIGYIMLLFTLCLTIGCNTAGPRALLGARLDYNQVLAQSRNEQLLLNLVRLRYRDTPLFLEVESVNTQYNLEYSAGASSTFIRPDAISVRELELARNDVAGTLVRATAEKENEYGLKASIGYYERPTISYSPLQGQAFVRQLLSPIPLDALLLLSQSGWSIERIMLTCVERMNGLDNASTASGPTPDRVPNYTRFARAAYLMRVIQRAEGLRSYAKDIDNEHHMHLHFTDVVYDLPELNELRALLSLPDNNNVYVCKEGFAIEPGQPVIAIQTRTLLGVLHYLSNSVEPPASHIEKGLVTQTYDEEGNLFEWTDMLGRVLRIHSSLSYPTNASNSVKYRNAWFYIDDADLDSKTTFGLLSYLFYLQAGHTRAHGPALTLSIGQ